MIAITEGEISEITAYKPRTVMDINQLALDLVEGRAFASWQLTEAEVENLHLVFMPLTMMDEVQCKQMVVDGIKHFFGYYKDTFPHSINGLPIFHAIGTLNQSDASRVAKAANAIFQMREQFLRNDHSNDHS